MQLVIPLALITVASALAARRWPVIWAQVLIWVLVLQNIIAIALWKVTGSASLATNFIYAKEVMIAGGAIVAAVAVLDALRKRRVPVILWLALAFGAVCVLWVPVSYVVRHEHLEQIARGLRSLAFPIVLLVIGLVVLPGRDAALRLRGTLWWTGVVLGLSVVVERTFVPPHFWLAIGLDRYWVDVKGESLAMLNGGLPWNFFAVLFGATVRRGFGIMTDPLALSYFLLLPLALAVAEICRSRVTTGVIPRLPAAAAVLSAVGITFSLSRVPMAIGAALVVLAPLVMVGLLAGERRRAVALAAVSVAIFGGIALVSVVTTPHIGPAELAASAPLGVGSEGAHLQSALRARDWIPLMTGRGLGTAGYLSAKFADTGADIGYENVYLDTAAQVGIAGALLLAAILAVTTLSLLRARTSLLVVSLPTAGTLAMLAVAGTVSGQLEVITSLGTTWLFAGVVLGAVLAELPQSEEDAMASRRDVSAPADLAGRAGTRPTSS